MVSQYNHYTCEQFSTRWKYDRNISIFTVYLTCLFDTTFLYCVLCIESDFLFVVCIGVMLINQCSYHVIATMVVIRKQ